MNWCLIKPALAPRFASGILLGVFLLQTNAQVSAEREQHLISAASSIVLGDSAADVARKVESVWSPVTTNRFLERYPFNQLIPRTNSAVISEWRTKEVSSGNVPWVLFVIFSDSRKTNVVDVLHCNGGVVQPYVKGPYDRNLHGIRKGDSVQKVYALLGKQNCEYVLGDNSKWQARFVYMDSEGRFIEIRVDAATGLVLETKDTTI